MAYDGIINYFVNPSEHIAKRTVVLFTIILLMLIVDGFFGFSDFYFAKSKAESLHEISKCLNDTTISHENKLALQRDFDRISKSVSYKVVLVGLLRSFNSNKKDLSKEIASHPPKETAKQEKKNRNSTSSDHMLYKITMYILTGGLFYFLLSFGMFRVHYKNKKEKSPNYTPQTAKIATSLLIAGLITPAFLLALPPYRISGWDRYMLNVLYGLIASLFMSVFMLASIPATKKSE